MSNRKRNREFWESATINNATARQYYDRLTELSLSMFEWTGLPDSIDPRFLELTLFSDGKIVFFKDEEIGYTALPCTIGGGFNVYRIPLERQAYAVNGYHKQLTDKDSVIIFNNYLHRNSMLDVAMFAKRLGELDRTIDVNCAAQKTPILITCPEEMRLSYINLYKEYTGNAPMIAGSDKLKPDALQVLQTGAPYVSDKLYELKTQYWNEALTYLGISNVNTQKRERMITDEVSRNQGGVIASRHSRLESRRQACKQINTMFGLNIDCNYREDFRVFDENMVKEEDLKAGDTDNE